MIHEDSLGRDAGRDPTTKSCVMSRASERQVPEAAEASRSSPAIAIAIQ